MIFLRAGPVSWRLLRLGAGLRAWRLHLCPVYTCTKNPKLKFSDNLLAGLEGDFIARRMGNGTSWLEAHRAGIEMLDPSQKNSARLLGILALWVEAGFSNPTIVRELLCRFPENLTKDFSVFDYIHLRVAQSLVDMADENCDLAIGRLEITDALEGQAGFAPLVVISNYWIGKCHRRMGRFDQALRHTLKARDLCLQLGDEKMAAVIRILEGWLIFKKGKSKEATRILGAAETILLGTDDHVSLGNIQFAYARISRRERRYDAAVVHFTAAITEFKRWTPAPPDLARSLTNLAIVKQFIALQLQHKTDHEVARRRRRHEHIAARVDRMCIEHLRQEAQVHLAEAQEIYQRTNDNHGCATVHLSRGQVYLNSGELDRAGAEAEEAYRLGRNKNDFILMARARVLGSMVENAKFEEQIEEPDPCQHARLASQLAHEAGEWALRTPSRRLLAKTLVAKSFILSNDFFNDAETARECADRATDLLGPTGHDYLWQDLQVLKDRVHRVGGVDSALREWSHGQVGDKTFQQIAEEFAGIVIPKVWKLEGRKISRVAARLSISPKKVRRILSRQGLLRMQSPVQ
jgi:tetratricopeptide (TPR) repeat protein